VAPGDVQSAFAAAAFLTAAVGRATRARRQKHARGRALAEIIVIQPENSGVCSKPQFVRTDTPGQIVVDEESCSPPALHPSIVKPS
jgi:hypothetical protein